MTDADKAYQIAEDRIERAKRSGAKLLSLSPHYAENGKLDRNATPELAALDRIPETIADLTDLQTLYLHNTKVEDISPLAAMTGMQTLYLDDTQVEDISPLAAMTGMQTLTLHNTKVEDISPLAAMTGMQRLYLDDTKVEDISALAAMTGMQSLYLDYTQVEDISPLAAMTGMQTLYLYDTQVEDISPLAAMTGMHTLYLSGTQVEDISPLAAMTGMQTLHLSSTQVEDISPLAAMTGMQTLHLNYTKVDVGQLVAEGAAWVDEDHALRDLEFRNTPATMEGECLEGIHEAADSDKDRTKAALAALRAERDRRQVEGAEAVEPPEQRPEGPAYTLGPDNRIKLVDPSLGPDDAEQEVLRTELLDHLAALITALAGSNEFATLRSRAERYQDLLSKAPEDIGARAAWALANALRRALEAEEAAAASGRSSDQLPPIAASELAGAVETGGLWLMGHPGVAEVERAARDYRYGPETPAELEAAENLITDMSDALDDDSRTILGDLLATAKEGMAAGVQATKVVLDAGWNLVSFITRTVWLAGDRSLKAVSFVGGVSGGAALLGKLILTHEAAIRAYLLVEAPMAVGSLDALVAAIRAAAKFFGV